MKINLLLLLILFFSLTSAAQDFPYGKPDTVALSMQKYDKDPSANAVVLQEYGTSKITAISNDDINLVFEYHVRIKIFNSKGFENGNVSIKLRNIPGDDIRNFNVKSFEEDGVEKIKVQDNTGAGEQIEKISGITYYPDEDGLMRKADLDPATVSIVKGKDSNIAKFQMPGLHDGCIIEYRYNIISPFFMNHFRTWEFQSDIPKISSVYEVHIPGHFTYNSQLRGHLKLTTNDSRIEADCFNTQGAKSDCSDIIYGMTNVPAFVEDAYMTAPKNFKAAIEFNLTEFVDPFTSAKINVSKKWGDVDNQLRSFDGFGGQLKRKDVMKDRIGPAITGKTNDLEKTQAIYTYLQKWFKWNGNDGIYSAAGIKKAYDTHNGNIADINLALIAALNSAGINTEAVLVSTRDNGMPNDAYPSQGYFNYVVAKANIGDASYLLDATDPLLPFGMLPLKCLNDKGRVFSLDKPSYWINMNTPQKKTSTYTFDLTLQDDGKLKGTLIVYSAGYAAYEKRVEIKKTGGADVYFKRLDDKIKILKSNLSGIDSLDQPVTETYQVEIDAADKQGKTSFDPFLLNRIAANPFKLDTRSYPIDYGVTSDTRVTVNLHLPANYTIENQPVTSDYTMPNSAGVFLTNFDNSNNSITLSYVIKLNKPVYTIDEYASLKNLYDNVISTEKTDIVFKKKSYN